MTKSAATLPPGLTPRMLDVDEAARYLGMSPNSFEKYIAPEVPPQKWGTIKLWDIRALDKYLDEKSGISINSAPDIGSLLEGLGNERRQGR